MQAERLFSTLRARLRAAPLLIGLAVLLSVCLFAGSAAAANAGQHLLWGGPPPEPITLPDVSYDQSTGLYLVVWEQTDQAGDRDIWGIVVNGTTGVPTGPAFLIAACTDIDEHDPKVASADGGFWIVSWIGQCPPPGYAVQVAQVTAAGGVSAAFTVTGPTLNPILHDDVGVSIASGNYLIVWDLVVGQGLSDIRGQMCSDSQIPPLVPEITIATGYDERNPSVNQRGNDFLVAWEYHYASPPGSEIWAQELDPGGNLVGPQHWVDGDGGYLEDLEPSVASDASLPECFLVVWQEEYESGLDWDVWHSFVPSGGAPGTPAWVQQACTTYDEIQPCAAYTGLPGTGLTGTFFVGWAQGPSPYWVMGVSLRKDAVGTAELLGYDQVFDSEHPEATPLYSGQGKVVLVWDRLTGGPPVGDTNLYANEWWLTGEKNGLYNPANGTFYLRYSNSAGAANATFRFGPTASTWLPLAGDWDGCSGEGIGLYNPANGTFYLKHWQYAGPADITVRFGPTASTWKPLTGDWDGDGDATLGLYNAASGTFYLRNSNTAGAADLTFRYGPTASTWLPVLGDWDGDGTETIGLYNAANGTFYLRNANSAGAANLTFRYGPTASTWKPVTGDWDQDGMDTIGLYNPATGTYYLRNSNTAGAANITFRYGPTASTWTPIAGDWTGD